MLVRINGKMVEVGPGRTHKKDCGCIGKLFQTLAERAHHQKSRLIINGHEVDMDDPDDVQRAIRSVRISGGIIFCFGMFCLFIVGQSTNSLNADDSNVMGGIMAVSIWLLIGSILFIFVPKTLQKRLDELKRQGKVPSAYKK